MKDQLDVRNEEHLWILHWTDFRLVSEDLQNFVALWNQHSLSTANHKSPNQLFFYGIQKMVEASLVSGIYISHLAEETIVSSAGSGYNF